MAVIIIKVIAFPRDIVCLRNMSINILHRGHDDNNKNKILYFWVVYLPKFTGYKYCLITLYIHRIRVTNDVRSAVTIQIKKNHHQHRTVSRVIWGFAVFITLWCCAFCGPGSSVGIVIELRAGRSRIDFRWAWGFPPVQTGPGANPASCKTGTWTFLGVKCGRSVLLTTHPF